MIDIVLTSLNRWTYLRETVTALFNRTRFPCRIFILDDGSDPATQLRIYSLKDSRLISGCFLGNSPRGLFKKNNLALEMTDSEIFVLSDGDILVPNLEGECWLKRANDLLEANPNVAYAVLQRRANHDRVHIDVEPYSSGLERYKFYIPGYHMAFLRRSAFLHPRVHPQYSGVHFAACEPVYRWPDHCPEHMDGKCNQHDDQVLAKYLIGQGLDCCRFTEIFHEHIGKISSNHASL
jgi:hypothetical protein